MDCDLETSCTSSASSTSPPVDCPSPPRTRSRSKKAADGPSAEGGVQKRTRRPRSAKKQEGGEPKPKKPLSQYNIFMQKTMSLIQSDRKEQGLDALPHKMVWSMSAARWKTSPENKKAVLPGTTPGAVEVETM